MMALSVIAADGFIGHPWRRAGVEQLMPLFAIDPVYGAAGRSFLKDCRYRSYFAALAKRQAEFVGHKMPAALLAFCRRLKWSKSVTWEVNLSDQEGVRSCPLYSTCFITSTVVPASPKCEGSF
ncbi:hypothetical protein ACVILK_006452 [Bradyrhizobium embrapense]